MNYSSADIVLQEVPNEISLCFSITGCKVACKGCHSTHLWNADNGMILTDEIFICLLNKYDKMISCVLFMGGEWQHNRLIVLLKIAKLKGLKTCLYTGENSINAEILKELTFAKFGKWSEELGGLNSSTTNQKFIDVKSGECLNHLFVK